MGSNPLWRPLVCSRTHFAIVEDMKTRFLLHGGRVKLADERNDSFFRELVKDLGDGDIVLSIGFANRDDAGRLEYFERDKGLLLAQAKTKIQVVNATYDDLEDQIKAAKSIYITGGEAPELVHDVKKYPNFLKLLSGKLVAGTSAGACLFSSYYLNCPKSEIRPGLAVFPIRLAVHYGNPEFNSTDETVKLLEEFPHELELVRLQECEWIEKEIEL